MKKLLLCLALLAALPAPLSAQMPAGLAKTSYATQKPLMVVRYNQRNVAYDTTLASVVGKALQTKPDMVFYVVSVRPSQAPSKMAEQIDAQANQQLNDFLARMIALGVPESRMQSMSELLPVRSHEIRLFVE